MFYVDICPRFVHVVQNTANRDMVCENMNCETVPYKSCIFLTTKHSVILQDMVRYIIFHIRQMWRLSHFCPENKVFLSL